MCKEKIYPIRDFIRNEKDTILLMCIMTAVLSLLLWGCITLLRILYKQIFILSAEVRTWDVVIIASLIAGIFSLLLLCVTKSLDWIFTKMNLSFEKKIATYEAVVAFIFKYQPREGYIPSFSREESQQALFAISQQILLWGSIKVQREWSQYIAKSWNQDNYSYQMTIPQLFFAITKEIGQKIKRDSLYDNSLLSFLYDQGHYMFVNTNPVTGKTMKFEVCQASSAHK